MIRCNVCKKQIINRRVKLNGKYYHPSCGFIKTMRMKNKSKTTSLVNYILVSLLILPMLATLNNAEIFNGDTVYINSTNAYISASPHTIYGDDYITIEVLSKQFTGNINVLFGFNSENALPKSLELVNREMVEVFDVNGSYMEEQVTYQNIASQFTKYNHDFDGKNVWYVATNLPIISGKTYELKMFLDLIGGDGKYDVAFYPSSYGANIGQAISSGNFEFLDPYYNVSHNNGTIYYFSSNLADFDYIEGNGTSWTFNDTEAKYNIIGSDNSIERIIKKFDASAIPKFYITYSLKLDSASIGEFTYSTCNLYGTGGTTCPSSGNELLSSYEDSTNWFNYQGSWNPWGWGSADTNWHNVTIQFNDTNNNFRAYKDDVFKDFGNYRNAGTTKTIILRGKDASNNGFRVKDFCIYSINLTYADCLDYAYGSSNISDVYSIESFIIPNPHTNNNIVYYYSNFTLNGLPIENATCYDEIDEGESVQFYDTETNTNNFTLTQTFNRVMDFGETDAGEHNNLDMNITIKKQAGTVNNISFYTCFERYDIVSDFTLCERKQLSPSIVSTSYDDYVLSFNNTLCGNKCNVSLFITYTGTNPYIIKTDTVNSGHFYRIVAPSNFLLLNFEPYIKFDLDGKNMTFHYNATSGLYYDNEDYSFEVLYHQDAGNFTNNFKCVYNGTLYTDMVYEIINPNGSIINVLLTDPINPFQNQTIRTASNTPVDVVNYTITAPNGSVYNYYNQTTITFEVLDISGLWTGTVYVLSNEFNWNETRNFNYSVNCIENWECDDYSSVCVGGLISRTCTDLNSCGSSLTKPVTQSTCIETGQAIKEVGILGLLIIIWIIAIILSVIMKKGSWLMIASVIGFVIFLTETDIRTIIRVLMMGINFALFFMGIDIVRGKGK